MISYTEFDTTAANFAAAVGAALRTDPDWTQPNAGAFPGVHKCTNDDGVDMVIDLDDTVETTTTINLAVYRSWADGAGAGVDKITKPLAYKRNVGGTTANIIHVVLSWSKNHLLITIEGPRAGEANPDSVTYGSLRQYFFMDRLARYLDIVEDPTPAVVCGHSQNLTSHQSWIANVSRNVADTQSWVPTRLSSLTPITGDFALVIQPNKMTADGTAAYGPYVVDADADGRRGRLANIFFAGYAATAVLNPEGTYPAIGAVQQYGGANYRLIGLNKSDSNGYSCGPLGGLNGNGAAVYANTVVVAALAP